MDRRILIHCIAGGPFGIGHLSRCLTLADALRDRGVAPTFLIFKGEPAVEGWVKDRGYAVHALPSAGVPPECGPVVEVFERSDFSLLILDGYIFETPYLDDLDGAGVPTLYMDDMMSLAYPCPLVFNQNFYARPEYFRIRNGTRLLLGPRYALVREEFRQARGNLHRTGRGEMRRLLVTGGGGDATVGGRTDNILRGNIFVGVRPHQSESPNLIERGERSACLGGGRLYSHMGRRSLE